MTRPGSVPPSAEQLAEWLGLVGRSQDRSAFEKLFVHFGPRLRRYMAQLGADAATAEDLAQEALVQVWRKASTYDPTRAAASSWIFAVARNLRIDRLRRRPHHEIDLDNAPERQCEDADGHERAQARVDAERLAALVQTLPADQVEVVRLSFYEGLSHAEIGARLGLPLGTVKSRLRLAFGKLRQAFGADV